jgi:hypothetical protein
MWMRTVRHGLAFLIGLSIASLATADEPAATKPRPEVLKALLVEAQRTGTFPADLVIRVRACLGSPDHRIPGEELPDSLLENWEFSANQVHRIEYESKEGKSNYRRLESRPFETKALCGQILEGKAVEIHAKRGTGPQLIMVGSRYERGSRSIEVLWKGEELLSLGETNGPALIAYRQTDAIAFGALYEHLAQQARDRFSSKVE